MKSIEYFLTKEGQEIVEDPKYLEEEREILKILKDGRKNIYQILTILKENGIKLSWYLVERKLKLLEKDKLVEELK